MSARIRADELPADDERRLDHPSHHDQWMELADVLGEMDARKQFEAIYGRPPRGTLDDNFKIKARHKRGAGT
jgi:hypothetical protein